MVLIINNHSYLLEDLKHWLRHHPCDVKELDDDVNPDLYDLIVLSGGCDRSVINHEDYYAKELSFLRSVRPEASYKVVGICLGYELIARAFGSSLEYMPEKEHGVVGITTNGDSIFAGIPSMKVYESHQWKVHELGGDLKQIATSKDGIEAVQHVSLPIYGFQFHPEKVIEGEEAARIKLLANITQVEGRSAAVPYA